MKCLKPSGPYLILIGLLIAISLVDFTPEKSSEPINEAWASANDYNENLEVLAQNTRSYETE
ncbi:MAG: hypothetical protein MK078_16100 [Crocinitomicaceae bacterium]|nr:hypothetical protein [Crocinitomicaceae bacterium]